MSKKMSRRKKRRQGSGGGMPMGGAGLIRFFEDSSIGVKVSPIAAVIMSAALIGVVIMGHLGVFEWLLTPAT